MGPTSLSDVRLEPRPRLKPPSQENEPVKQHLNQTSAEIYRIYTFHVFTLGFISPPFISSQEN